MASTTSPTYTKSRVWWPSPYTVTGSPTAAAAMKRLITPEYSEAGSCRGPKTLKKRRQAAVSCPASAAAAHISSEASFASA